MPNRYLREDILSSEKVSSLSWAEEVFYRRLMSIVDDYGRYEADPTILRSRLYPRQIEKVNIADVEKWMLATAEAGLVSVYSVPSAGEKKYLQLENFNQKIRSKSKFPAPPFVVQAPANVGACQQMPTDVGKCFPISRASTNSNSSTNPRASTSEGPPTLGIFKDPELKALFDSFVSHVSEVKRKPSGAQMDAWQRQCSDMGKAKAIAALNNSINKGLAFIAEPFADKSGDSSPMREY